MFSKSNLMRSFCLGIAVLLVFLALPPVAAAQTAATQVTWNLPSLFGGASIRLEGYRPVAAVNLTIPSGWQPSTDGALTLDYRLSDLVVQGATLTVRLNGHPITSAGFESKAGLFKINIPGDYFLGGENVLELAALLPLEEDITCIIPNHPGRWLEFGPDSALSLALEPTNDPLVLSEFPGQFELLGDITSTPITFVVSATPSRDEYQALSVVGSALAQSSKTAPRWQTVFASEFDTRQVSGPVILVSQNGNMPQLDALMPSNGAKSGWLSLTRPDWSGGYPVLAVGGPNGETLLQAARALSDPLAVAQMGTDIAIVDSLPALEPYFLAEQFTLADLGYGERVLKGTGELSLIYSFDVPIAWSPEDGQLILNFTHSANLNPETATLTVLLNGHTAVGLRLDAPEISTNAVKVSIPKDFIRPGRNFLRLAFDFGPPIDSCFHSTGQQSWASVRPETSLSLPHGNQGGRLDLRDFPFTFASETDMAELSIILPENATPADFNLALDLVRNLSATGNRFAPRFAPAGDLDPKNKAGHIIVIGTYDGQPLLSNLEAYLPVSSKNNPLTTYGIRLPTDAPDLGFIQVFRSPWAENRAILVVSGKTKAGYEQAMQVLVNPLLQAELADQLVFVWRGSKPDSPHVYVQRLPELATVPGVGLIDRLFGQYFEPGSPWPIIILVAVLLLVLAIASAFILKWMRRRQEAQSGGH